MTPRPKSLYALLAGLTLLLGACASTPATRLHTLLQAGGSGLPSSPQLVIALDPVSLPAPLDQMAWLLRQPDGSLQVLEHERWAAPLRDELRAALLQGLARRAGAIDQSQTSLTPRWRVQVHVTQFDSQASGADLEALWSISPANGSADQHLSCSSQLHQDTIGDVPALAAGQAANVSALAAHISRALQALQANTRAACR